MTEPALQTSDATFRSLVHRWIAASGEVLVLLQLSGSGEKEFVFCRDTASFDKQTASLPAQSRVTVYRDRQLPLRGIVDDNYVQSAIGQVPDGSAWLVIALKPMRAGTLSWYPNAEGTNHEDLIDDLLEFHGAEAAMGAHPPPSDRLDEVATATVPDGR
ncbi:hypothetical protein BH09PSE6_BH09PSE6_01860 [soil metagenome]